MLKGLPVEELAQEISRMAAAKRDYTVGTHQTNAYGGSDGVYLEGVLERPARINKHALGQIADKTGITRRYMNHMIGAGEFDLVATNINKWFRDHGSRSMFRCLDFNDGKPTLRAVLSDRYQRFDSVDLMNAITPLFGELPGLRFEATHCDYSGFDIKLFWPGKTGEIEVGDVIEVGARVKSNEVGGGGAFTIVPATYRLVCKNGMIYDDSRFSKSHIQRTFSKEYENVISDRTRNLADETTAAEAYDILSYTLKGGWLDTVVSQFQKAKGVTITVDQAKKEMEKVELPQKTQDLILTDMLSSGLGANAFSLVNAVTHVAHTSDDILNLEKAWEMSTELEKVGGKLLSNLVRV